MLFQTSLLAAFVAGVVALFAPCCVTVLLPAVLGVAAISKFLFINHDIVYLISAFVMILVSFITFLGIKLPMPNLPGKEINNKPDVLSVFTLGVFSGITSACCAPVLIGILTLTF